MRQFSTILSLIGVLSLLTLMGCGSGGSESNEHSVGSESNEHSAGSESNEHSGGSESNEHGGGSESNEHSAGSESNEHGGGSESGGEGEESGTRFALSDTFDEVRAGARLVLSYDSTANAFIGTVENTTGYALSRVRVEVHLSNGAELGPTPPVDLNQSQGGMCICRGLGRGLGVPQ